MHNPRDTHQPQELVYKRLLKYLCLKKKNLCIPEQENSQIVELIDILMEAPFYGMIDEVRVLLVDNDKAFLTDMVVLLKTHDS